MEISNSSPEDQNLQKILTTEPFLNTPQSPEIDQSFLKEFGPIKSFDLIPSNSNSNIEIYEIIFENGLKYRGRIKENIQIGTQVTPVSYTHLTLPTKA